MKTVTLEKVKTPILKAAIGGAKYTDRELARRAGVPVDCIRKLKSGERLSQSVKAKICSTLGLKENELFLKVHYFLMVSHTTPSK